MLSSRRFQNIGFVQINLLILAMIVGFTSCTKKRDESFVQGQGRDLLLIADYDGAEFEAETLDKIADYKETPMISKGENVTHSKKSSVAAMTAVKVNTKADLLGDAPFIALPNQKTGYKIKYMISNDYLVVLKVADKSLIHPQEIPGAMTSENAASLKLAKDQIAIPIVGYPIRGFVNSENVEQGGQKSNKLLEMQADDKAKAKYFKIDKNSRTLYKLQDKLDLFSKEYFAGREGKSEWYFGQTIIAAGGRNSDYTGWVLAQQDNELNALSKVRFEFNRSELRAISVNTDSRINTKDEINQTVLVNMPIEWKEYRASPLGAKGINMYEEENNSVDWDKRSYIKVDFARASTISISSPNFRFVDMEVDTDYFSFTLFDPDNNIRIKHSFLRDQGRKAYVAKRMLKEDFEKFGFFDTQKHEINNFEKYRQEDYGKNVFINRFNVANGEIVFHFTEGSDEKLIPAAAKAVEEWSSAFAKAGVPVKIKANTTDRVKLGDIRYNQINLIRTANESNLFGYGPSITDPRTGEIISATTNIHVTSIVSALASHIRDYMMYKSGKTKSLSMFVEPPKADASIVLKGDKVAMQLAGPTQKQRFINKFPVMGLNGQVELKDVEYVQPTEKAKIRAAKNWGREFDIGVTGKHLNEEIDEMCPELGTAVKALADEKVLEKENEMVIACAEKIVPYKMFGTLLHEMGHNFGLRHNFYGSVDAKNFLSKEETKTKDQVHSSSVMEYPSFGEDRLTKVGLYDIAAIRFGYGDSVETADGKVVKISNTNKSIAENLKAQNLVQKQYMFCTDEDVTVGTDPMCARHDAGTTPDEVVENTINEYNASIADYNYRLGRQRAVDPMRLTDYRIQRYWIPLKRFYDEWRFKLNDHLGIGNEYLENYDAAKLDSIVKERIAKCDSSSDTSSADCQFKYYKNAAEKVFKFSMQVATLPPKYCIGERNGKLASVEFADIRRIIMAVNKFVPENCMNEEVKKYVQEKYSFTPKSESGYELEDVRLDMKVKMSKTKTDWFGNPLPESPDVIGLMPEKMIAIQVLAVRAPLSYSAEEKTFKPNLLDEPRYREAVLAYLADRLTKGLNAKRLLSDLKSESGTDLFLEKYKYERRYIDGMVSSVFYGLDVPDNTVATKKRKKKFLVKYTDKKDILDKAKFKVAGPDGTTFYAVMTEDGVEAIKLLTMLETLPKRLEQASPLTEKTFDGLVELVDTVLGKDENIDATKFAEFMHQVMDDEFNSGLCSTKPTARSKEKLDIDKFRPHWKKVLGQEIAVFRAKLQSIFTPGSGDGPGAIAGCDMMSNMSGWYVAEGENSIKELKSKTASYNLNKTLILERIEAYKKAATQETKSAQNDDVFNYEELRSQMDMILNVLRSMTDY